MVIDVTADRESLIEGLRNSARCLRAPARAALTAMEQANVDDVHSTLLREAKALSDALHPVSVMAQEVASLARKDITSVTDRALARAESLVELGNMARAVQERELNRLNGVSSTWERAAAGLLPEMSEEEEARWAGVPPSS
jgi:citrate synthase